MEVAHEIDPERSVTTKAAKPPGRPSDFAPDLAAAICERIADGDSLKDICANEAMPARSTVYLWLAAHTTFSDMYTRAREEQADFKFDQAWQIAKDATAETVGVARLQVDTIKWQAAKLRPKAYSDKLEMEHTGALTVEIVRFGEG